MNNSKEKPEEIKKVISNLSSNSRDSLLILLLTQQQQSINQQTINQQTINQQTNNQQKQSDQKQQESNYETIYPLLNYYPFLNQWDSNQIPQTFLPGMTCTSSAGSYHHSSSSISDTLSPLHQPLQSSNPQLDFFSPLTSPALRPMGYHNSTPINDNNPPSPNLHALPHTIPALIDQAAMLGLSTPQSFIPHDLIPSNPNLSHQHDISNQTIQNNYLNTSAPTHFSSPSNFMIHSNHQPTHQQLPINELGINQLPINDHGINQLPINDLGINHHDSSNLSPLILPHQSLTNLTIPNNNPKSSSNQSHLSGRARPVRNTKNRPSPLIRPIDDSSKHAEDRSGSSKRARSLTALSGPTSPEFPSVLAQIGLTDSPSPIDLNSREINILSSSSSVRDNLNNHSIPPQTPPNIPLTHALPTPSSNSKTWHIQPMTPASLLNFEKPSALASSGFNGSKNISSHAEDLDCTRLHSVVETNESSDILDEPNFNGQNIIQDHHLNLIEQTRQACKSIKSDGMNSKEKNTLHGSDIKTRKSKTDDGYEKNKEGKQQQKTVRIQVKNDMNDEVPEHRKSSHKVAEQRRRDSLKMCFEDLRKLLPPIHWDEKEEQIKRPGEGNVGGQRTANVFDPSNPNKGISKVALLRRSNEYIICLRERLKQRDSAIERMVQIMQENPLLTTNLSSSNQIQNSHSSSTNSKEVDHIRDNQDHQLELNQNERILEELKLILTQIGLEKQQDKDNAACHLSEDSE